MRRKRVRRRRRVTGKKTRTWRMTKVRKEKVVEGGRGGIVDFMAAKPLPTHGTSENRGGQPRRLDTQAVRTQPPKSARVCNSDVLRVLRVLRVPEVCF